MIDKGHNGGPTLRDAGWYATHRDMLNHPIVGICQPVNPADPKRGSASRFEAWHWLIASASYGEREWMNKGQLQTIQPGQLVAGRAHLSHVWNWTEKTVRVFLKQLLDEQMITLATDSIRGQQRANTANIITLCNYLRYQLSSDDEIEQKGPAKGQPRASQGPAKGQIENKETNKQENKGTSFSSTASQIDPLAKVETPKAAEQVNPADAAKAQRRAINRQAAQQAFTEWQEFAQRIGLAVPRNSSFATFGQKMAARMYQHADDPKGYGEMLSVWRLAMSMVERSKLCRGMTQRKFFADLKFMCQPESFDRLITGGYGNGAHSSTPTTAQAEADRRLAEAYEKIHADSRYEFRPAGPEEPGGVA